MASSAGASKKGGVNAPRSNTNNGIDKLLTVRGKSLFVGQEMRFTLIKSSQRRESSDPLDPKAPVETFPLVAKFPASIVKPDFNRLKRFYQQDIPSQKDDSDEEEEQSNPTKKKKRWRGGRKDAPKRQWVLQEETDYLETMISRQEQGKAWKQDPSRVSSRYEALPEHNPSHYAIFSVAAAAAASQKRKGNEIEVTMLPTPFAIQGFSQPARVQTMSMTEAEQAIQDQRSHMSRYMMHKRMMGIDTGSSDGGSKARLMGRLQALSKKKAAVDNPNGEQDGDDDDVMGDVKFESRKGGSSRARKELLSSFADEGVKVDVEGVLGGANDSEFAGKRRFAKLNVENASQQQQQSKSKGGEEEAPAAAERVSNDGLAMSDDFYHRDVKAEYEELDYDANDQFDDDDVDIGEAEVAVEGGFGVEELDDDDDDDDDEEDDDNKNEGFASVKGLKDMLAKARGEVVPTPGENANKDSAESKEDEDATNPGGRSLSPKYTSGASSSGPDKKDVPSLEPSNNSNNNGGNNNGDTMNNTNAVSEDNNLAQVIAAAERTRDAAKGKKKNKKDPESTEPVKPSGVTLDEHGQRVLSLEAVRYEIFLHNKSIQTKKLMKIFSIKKKSARDRIKKFQAIIKELCIIQKDPVQGNLLVLKQHYAK